MIATQKYIPPSIGKIGEPYYNEPNDRIKYFCTDLHYSIESIDSKIEDCLDLMHEYKATRINARFFAKKSISVLNTEATIPLAGDYSDFNLIFVGINSPDRMDNISTLKDEVKMVDYIRSHPHIHPHVFRDYKFEMLSIFNTSKKDLNDLFWIYKNSFKTYTSELNIPSIKLMIDASKVYVARTKKEGSIVSVAVGELSEIDTDFGRFKISELSEMATLKEHRRKGLVTHAAKLLIEDLNGSVDLIYSEARACHRPINQSFFNMGFNYAGRLNKQCILSGDYDIAEKGKYENLNVWYKPRGKI